MVYPGVGIAVSTGAAWGTSKATPAGVIVGDTDVQTLTNKTLTSPTTNNGTSNTETINTPTLNGGTVVPPAAPVATNPGYLGIPQNGQAASYTLVMSDISKDIYLTGSVAAQSVTIPANASVAFPIGTVLTITNDSTVPWTIPITTDVLLWSPSGGTGTRTLAANGSAAILKKTATRWWITGNGLT